MNDIFNHYIHLIITYIDDVLIYSNSIEQHFNLAQFHKIAKINGIILSKMKMNLVQTKIIHLGHGVETRYIPPIQRFIEFFK